MKIAVTGIGGYFGGRLTLNGQDVKFLAREHLKAIQSNGLTVKSINGDFKMNPVQVTDNIDNPGRQDLVILGTKAWQVREVAKTLEPLSDDESIILPLQNGIEAIDELTEHVKPRNVIGGLCRIISKIESPE